MHVVLVPVAASLPSSRLAAQPTFAEIARLAGEPQVSDFFIVYLHRLGKAADARMWKNIIAHQTEGPAGSACALAQGQFASPTKRGVMLWVETDGTVYWGTAETAVPTHGDGANRNDNKYIDNSKTYHSVTKTNSIGVLGPSWCASCRSVRHRLGQHLRAQLDRL